jgi:hypothetical protein
LILKEEKDYADQREERRDKRGKGNMAGRKRKKDGGRRLSGTLLRQTPWEKTSALGRWALTPVAVRGAQPVVTSGIV